MAVVLVLFVLVLFLLVVVVLDDEDSFHPVRQVGMLLVLHCDRMSSHVSAYLIPPWTNPITFHSDSVMMKNRVDKKRMIMLLMAQRNLCFPLVVQLVNTTQYNVTMVMAVWAMRMMMVVMMV